ncbi:hypothetical protein AWJ20_4279 [Sugiyamaella lignohabitans]|uniref:Uncharacterized protein n=1 Tax=Sugiyamaella lignohabitans TaxID=796027 RepID=A0A161HH98_9ASCO|nr:uncharacterized protein AWJ20_4279 [Sugiyamaella lignohabitans]ANB11467.1 hypothetical protein AWJ20_4279 [Sugiyamaella lignohabitans]
MIPASPNGGFGGFKYANDLPEGLPKIQDIFSLYASSSGWNPAPYWSFAVVYAHLRLCVITHGIAARIFRGQASSANAEAHAKSYFPLSALAMQEIEEYNENQSKL